MHIAVAVAIYALSHCFFGYGIQKFISVLSSFLRICSIVSSPIHGAPDLFPGIDKSAQPHRHLFLFIVPLFMSLFFSLSLHFDSMATARYIS